MPGGEPAYRKVSTAGEASRTQESLDCSSSGESSYGVRGRYRHTGRRTGLQERLGCRGPPRQRRRVSTATKANHQERIDCGARGPSMEAHGPAWLLRLAACVRRMRLYIGSPYLEGSRKISSRRHGEAVESDFARRPWSVSAAWLLRLPPGMNHRMGRWPATRVKGVYVAVGLPPGTRSRGGSLASREV